MVWNLAPEWISLAFLTIIMVYSGKLTFTVALRDKIFRFGLICTFISISCNLLSTYMLYAYKSLPAWSVIAVTTLYFCLTPLVSVVYFYYTVALLRYDYSAKKIHIAWHLFLIPYIIYLFFIVSNLWTGSIFVLDKEQGYVTGSHIFITYIVFFFYCCSITALAVIMRKRANKMIVSILLVFPMVALIFVGLQKLFPDTILTGTASVTTALILYLYLQSKQLSVDSLTGLLNRAVFLKTAAAVIQSNRPATAVVVSMNEFKNVNDHFGQARGDDLLCQTADFLQKLLPKVPVYRTSGDRFSFILFEKEQNNLDIIINAIQTRMKKGWHTGNIECMLSVSIAVANTSDTEGSLSKALSGMEYALSKCKRNPHMVYCRYEPSMRAAETRRNEVKKALEYAMKNDGFELRYQPVWSVAERRFVQAEALLRMKQTAIQNLFPDEFIPLSEETGIIVEMTYWILDTVCAFIARMDDYAKKHGEKPLERISINFSFLQFLQPDLKNKVIGIIEKNHVSFNRIKIEVTERLLIENNELVTRFMDSAYEYGIGFALDDFGVGYSNLEALLNLPFDAIKIDKGLVWTTKGNEEKEMFLKALTYGFHSLKRHVVAEGIETKEQLDFITACGCDLIQGYYFAKPMSDNECLEFLFES